MKYSLPSLAGGEVSPAIAARTDLQKYPTFTSECRNFTVMPFGGLQSRGGFRWVCEVKDSTKSVVLVPFSFSTTQTYVLEFGDQYLRVIRDGGLVLDSSATGTVSGATQATQCTVTDTGHPYSDGDEIYISGVVGMTELNGRFFLVSDSGANDYKLKTKAGVYVNSSAYTAWSSGGTTSKIYEVATPYAQADLADIAWVQSADVMTLTHPSYAPRELTRTDHDAWTITTIVFRPQQAAPTGVVATAVSTGSERHKYQVMAVNDETGERSLAGLATAAAFTITGVTKANPAVVTVSTTHDFDDGDWVHITGVVGMTELNDRYFRVNDVGATTFELQNENSTDYTAWSSGGTLTPQFALLTNGSTTVKNTITWDDVTDAGTYEVFREENGVYGFVGRTELLTFTEDNVDPDQGDTPTRLREPFLVADTYPSTAGYYQQRRVFSNTVLRPQTTWFTQTGNYYNMSRSSPSQDDDAIVVTLTDRQVNAIQHIVALKDLLLLTTGGEWLVKSDNGVLTPSTLQQQPQTFFGATKLPPIVVGDVVVYMQPGQIVRDLGYKFETDAYSGNDISILARHLFEGYEVVRWGFASAPYGQLWGVRDDGLLLCLTYLREQEIYGWSRHDTQGLFKSIAVIREDDLDVPYVLVERIIAGNTVQFIERIADRRVDDVQDAICLDASLCLDTPFTITAMTSANPAVFTTSASHGMSNGDTVDINGVMVEDDDVNNTSRVKLSTIVNGTGFTVANVAATTFELQNNGVDVDSSSETYARDGEARAAITTPSNLWHLEGHEVVSLANGQVVPAATVTNGSITLPFAASRVCVGLAYTARFKTVRAEIQGARQTVQARAKKASRLTIRVENSLGGWYGPDTDHMYETKFGLPALWGQPRPLVTDDLDVTMSSDWNKRGEIVVEQRDPLPLTVLSLIPDMELGGN